MMLGNKMQVTIENVVAGAYDRHFQPAGRKIDMTVTPIYAALAAFLFMFLSFRVIRMRFTERVGLGDGDNRALHRAIRVQGNFAEYAPFALLLMALAEIQGAPLWALNLLGISILAGRLIHALGFGREPERLRLRVAGMVITFCAIAAAALADFSLALMR
jgi:uncharacterized membrane protein YecN with MAPEG domain